MSTPHISANKGDIAKTVLMPGDPLRAKFIAETFLKDAVQYNDVRGMYGFTGTYKGTRVSVQGSGMGSPSIGIYSYELFNFFDVENIIRIGTAGAFSEELHIGDLVLGQGASGNSNYASQYQLPGTIAPIASFELLEKAVQQTRLKGCSYKVGNVLCSDIFYEAIDSNDKWRRMGVLAVEMESTALYLNAAYLGKKALTILTVSDEIHSGKKATTDERQYAFTNMMEIALETAAMM